MKSTSVTFLKVYHIDGLMQERHNSTANALELCLSCTNPSIWISQPYSIAMATDGCDDIKGSAIILSAL